MNLDKWQEDVLKEEGNICLRSGRQVGKSTIISIKAAEYAVKNANKTVMIVSATERQAYLLFEKVLFHLIDNHKKEIKTGRYRPTKSQINLKNGSRIYCLPTGISGLGIRGFTVHLLIADEAAFIPEDVWAAIVPMLTVTGGKMILLSTPMGRGGFFYDCFKDPKFTSFHVKTTDVAELETRDKIQREYILEYVESAKRRLSKLAYTQEVLGEFIDKLRQFFSDDLIKKCMVLTKGAGIKKDGDYYLGVDIARMGDDESTFEILRRFEDGNMVQIDNIVTKQTLTTSSTALILMLENKYDFQNIFIDDGGMGVGVFDQLLNEDSTKRKVVAINNKNRPLTRDEKEKKKIMKEDLYNNLLVMMEQDKIKLLDEDEIFLSLKSVQYEYTKKGKIEIFGKYTHIAEGLIRSAWGIKGKSLNIWIA